MGSRREGINPSPTRNIGGVQEMNRSKIIKLVVFFLVVYVLNGVSILAQSQIEDYKLFTQSIDAVSGTGESDSCLLRISSGGQPGVIGTSQGTSLYSLQGYVNTAAFMHGDCDGNGSVGLADVIYLINYLFRDGPEPVPYETGDLDCPNNWIDIADVVYLINHLFRKGPAPCNL